MKHTIFTSPEYSTAGPQAKDGRVCVTTGEGAGGVLATGQALYYLGLWPRPPRLSPPWWHAPSHLWIEVSEGLTMYQAPVDLTIIWWLNNHMFIV